MEDVWKYLRTYHRLIGAKVQLRCPHKFQHGSCPLNVYLKKSSKSSLTSHKGILSVFQFVAVIVWHSNFKMSGG